jgi:hypothetical protein
LPSLSLWTDTAVAQPERVHSPGKHRAKFRSWRNDPFSLSARRVKVPGAMDVLPLFAVEPATAVTSAASGSSSSVREPAEASWHEAELFLADHLERDGALAQIQVALALCDAAGGRRRARLDELTLDPDRFPRSAHAIARVIELLELPTAERPEGFWPRFLLDQLKGSTHS